MYFFLYFFFLFPQAWKLNLNLAPLETLKKATAIECFKEKTVFSIRAKVSCVCYFSSVSRAKGTTDSVSSSSHVGQHSSEEYCSIHQTS